MMDRSEFKAVHVSSSSRRYLLDRSAVNVVEVKAAPVPDKTPSSKSLAIAPNNGDKPDPTIFPFLYLPVEIRLDIYQYALVREEPLDVAGFKTKPCLPVALLRVNKQIYREARGILYSQNEFLLLSGSGLKSLAALNHARSMITRIAVDLEPFNFDEDDFFPIGRKLAYYRNLKTLRIVIHRERREAKFPFDWTRGERSAGAHYLTWLPQNCEVVLDSECTERVKEAVKTQERVFAPLNKWVAKQLEAKK